MPNKFLIPILTESKLWLQLNQIFNHNMSPPPAKLRVWETPSEQAHNLGKCNCHSKICFFESLSLSGNSEFLKLSLSKVWLPTVGCLHLNTTVSLQVVRLGVSLRLVLWHPFLFFSLPWSAKMYIFMVGLDWLGNTSRCHQQNVIIIIAPSGRWALQYRLLGWRWWQVYLHLHSPCFWSWWLGQPVTCQLFCCVSNPMTEVNN